MKSYVFYAIFNLHILSAPVFHAPPVKERITPVDIEYYVYNKAAEHTLSINSISVKDISCTIAELLVGFNYRGKPQLTVKIFYLKIAAQKMSDLLGGRALSYKNMDDVRLMDSQDSIIDEIDSLSLKNN